MQNAMPGITRRQQSEEGLGYACNLVKETNTYSNCKHQADSSHTRTWRVTRGFPSKEDQESDFDTGWYCLGP